MGDEQPEQTSAAKPVTGIAAISLGVATVRATARTRMHFAVQHLLAAARLARDVDSIEVANAGAEFGEFYDEILGSSVGCVVLAAAALEAHANELFADRGEYF